MPDPAVPTHRPRDVVRTGWPPFVAVVASLGLGFGAGAATAEVVEVPGSTVPTPAPVAAEPDPTVEEAAPASRVDARDAGPRVTSRSEETRSAVGALPLPDALAPLAPVRPPEPVEPPVPVPTAPEVPPTPAPAPAEPVAEPGSGLLGTEVEPDLGGVLVPVPGEVDAPGEGTVRSVRVEVEDGLPVDGEVLAEAVLTTLNDARGWGATDGVTFSRTGGDEPSIRVVLASPATTDRLCAPLQTEGTYSCGNAATGVAVLNFERWVLGAPDFGDDVATYRQYLVNHEVGHVLGHGHESCPGEGEVAPVMVQQSISTEGCLPNGWPAP
ncbi:DUF3152 domain-containing protein [Cellulosimicrobium marinum]|uniref:DUF3152 domain-containing protein n=1 Tax=Cellulosimicrobium marinum TaxID=1638992 RepID=UPI001E5FA778|nr:DUF3152 domain-containing protein [Cellulosimicrobium marinum]MCB7136628.1 DUF3152 domain-containing protein [Cellulosimicrobium marinum]